MMAAPSSLAHTLYLIHHINDETIVYLDLAKHEQDLIAYRAHTKISDLNKLDKASIPLPLLFSLQNNVF